MITSISPELFVILLVEDEPADAHLVRTALGDLREFTDLRHVQDGIEALAFLRRQGERFSNAPRPDLILLDLYMPRMNGKELLAAIKKDAGLRDIPVVILTISDLHLDMPSSYRLAAAGYITKPADMVQFTTAIRKLYHHWSALAPGCRPAGLPETRYPLPLNQIDCRSHPPVRRGLRMHGSGLASGCLACRPEDQKGQPASFLDRLQPSPETGPAESGRRFEAALAGADLALWEWHLHASRVMVSDNLAAMLGHRPSEIESRISAWRRLVPAADWPGLRRAVFRCLRGEAPGFQARHRLKHKDGHWVPVLLRGKVVERTADGSPVRAAGAVLDLSQGDYSGRVMPAGFVAEGFQVAELRQALEDSRLILHFQPQVSAGGRLVGAEALVRWEHPERGLIFPSDFIRMAEESGLILAIDRLVLETACGLLKAWESSPISRNLVLAVNISAGQFRQPGFIETVREVLARTGAHPSRLRLELTESAYLEQLEEAASRIAALKTLGITLSLDNFGADYSSAADISLLPVGQLKIDCAFISRLQADSRGASLVRSILALAERRGIEVVAEGVEEEGQYEFLKQHGCKLFQGYLFARPMPIEAFDRFRERRWLM